MSISGNSNNEGEQRIAFFAWSSKDAGTLVITLILLASGGLVQISPTPITSALAQEGNDTSQSSTPSNNITTSLPSEIELSSQPVYQEQEKLESQIPLNQTHLQVVVSGNGTLTLPNGTEAIRTTSTKTGIVSMMEGAFAGKEILTTEDGSENATATVYEIVRFNMQNGEGNGIAIAYIHTDSTGRLAPLEGMILTGIDELHPDGSGMLTLWEWQSGIPLLPPAATMGESPPLMNTTTTDAADADTTNATVTTTPIPPADIRQENATATTTEEEGEQQQTTTIPAPLLE